MRSSRADVLLLFILRTNSRTLRQSSTSSSSSSQPPCSQSAWRHFSSITAGSSVRTGPLWVCIYRLFSGFGGSLVDGVMGIRGFRGDSVCVCLQRLCALRFLAMAQIRMGSVWASARTSSKFLVMKANTGLSPCFPGKVCSEILNALLTWVALFVGVPFYCSILVVKSFKRLKIQYYINLTEWLHYFISNVFKK